MTTRMTEERYRLPEALRAWGCGGHLEAPT
jgi:hypothetical protein